jgi:hypothetical protein
MMGVAVAEAGLWQESMELWMKFFHKNVQASFAPECNFCPIHPIDSRVSSGGHMGGLDFTAGDHTHLHET